MARKPYAFISTRFRCSVYLIPRILMRIQVWWGICLFSTHSTSPTWVEGIPGILREYWGNTERILREYQEYWGNTGNTGEYCSCHAVISIHREMVHEFHRWIFGYCSSPWWLLAVLTLLAWLWREFSMPCSSTTSAVLPFAVQWPYRGSSSMANCSSTSCWRHPVPTMYSV